MNDRQEMIMAHFDHPLLVDAGPGTGKTTTVVERYLKMVENDIDPKDVLMVTFTNNAATEMRDRIRARITGWIASSIEQLNQENGKPCNQIDWKLIDSLESKIERYRVALNDVKASTFDSLCLRIVLDAPEFVSEFFGFKGISLTRNAKLVQNDTLNKDYFRRFYATFINRYGHLYVKRDANNEVVKDIPMLFSDKANDIYAVITQLMSTGIIPIADGDWFSNGFDRLMGNQSEMERLLRDANESENVDFFKVIKENLGNIYATEGNEFGNQISDVLNQPKGSKKLDPEVLLSIIDGDRKLLLHFIHHVYYEFIRKSISDNRLTFGLTAVFAFCILYLDPRSRSMNSVNYLIVDEFQDTNEMQLSICLMLSKKDNICVVGDWKQGIYGFRFATIDNITQFEQKIRSASRGLNADGTKRVNIPLDVKVTTIPLNENYRSHGIILDWAFSALDANRKDCGDSPEVIRLAPKKNEDYGDHSEFSLYSAKSDEDEYDAIVNKITEYVGSDRYWLDDEGEKRRPCYGDIAILFEKGKPGKEMYRRLRAEGIPAFLQSDQEIMSSLPGKLALAWLRFINDKDDRRGISTILVHEGYSMSQIQGIYNEVKDGRDILEMIPRYLSQEREFLAAKRKRPNDLLTSIFAFHRIGDDDEYSEATQSIISAISSSFDTSLMTISDIIRLMEDDIENHTTYAVDSVLDMNAVTIQTMHKSKGLEYPIVIVGGVGKMPYGPNVTAKLLFDSTFGLRCRERFVNMGDGCIGSIKDWMYAVLKSVRGSDYDEKRRLLFVAMSRAKQYLFMTGVVKKNGCFMKYFEERFIQEEGSSCPKPQRHLFKEETGADTSIEPPKVLPYATRRRSLDVHSLITYVPAAPGSLEREGGKEYGNAVHFIADKLVKKRRDDLGARVLAEAYASDKGMDYVQLSEDAVRINRLIDGFGDAGIFSETPCSLPVDDMMIHGIIDLIVDDGDVISIYDYKTESDLRNLSEYTVQVSIYAHSVMQARGTSNVRAYLHYVTMGSEPMEVNILPMADIVARLERYKKETSEVSDADYR